MLSLRQSSDRWSGPVTNGEFSLKGIDMKSVILTAIAALLYSSFAVADETDWRQTAVDQLSEERAVVEAYWSQNMSLWVSVVDDGSRRDGLAQYVCLVLPGAGKPKDTFIVVTIWDHVQALRGELVELGKAECATG